MNEKILSGDEMINLTQDIKTVRDIIVENTLKTRPKKEIYYMPCKKQKGVYYKAPLQELVVDFNEIYADAEEGDFAYFEFDIVPMHELEVLINVKGDAEIEYNNKHIISIVDGNATPSVDYSFDSFNVPVKVEKNCENRVRIKCTKKENAFGVGFILSIKRYPSMWANDYLYWMRAVIPEGCLKGEEGVSVSELYKKGSTPDEILFKEPEINNVFDFNTLSDGGDRAYIYTVCKNTTVLKYNGTVSNVFVNGANRREDEIIVNKDDEILVECKKNDTDWSFEFDDTNFYLPFLRGNRNQGVNAVCLTDFSDDEWKDDYLDFKTVFNSKQGKKFWRFADGSYLRIYLDSVFYGQWFYALMVGFYGIRAVALSKNDDSLLEFFQENMKFMADYFEFIQYDADIFGMPTFMPRCVGVDNLDNSGTMGMNFVNSYFIHSDEKIAEVIDYLAEVVENRIPRFPDGTYYRNSTMWADDTYMSIPFLVRLYKYKNDKKWLLEAKRQIEGFKKRLYIPDKKIFSHIYFTDDGKANEVPWGRGNGWVMLALSEFLLSCDDEEIKKEVLPLYIEFANGIRKLQMDNGMWRQVLDCECEGSYPETSATAMFIISLARGVNNGWIDKSFTECINKAWTGLLTCGVDKQGNVYGVSMGSGCSREAKYYFDIQTNINDDHGTGIILAAACELLKL